MAKKLKRPDSYAECAYQLWVRMREIVQDSTTVSRATPMVGEDDVVRDGVRVEGVDLKLVMTQLWGLAANEIDRVTQQARRAAGIGQAEAIRNVVSGRGDPAKSVWWVADQWPERAHFQPLTVRRIESTTESEAPAEIDADSVVSTDLPVVDDDGEQISDMPPLDADELGSHAFATLDLMQQIYRNELKEARENLELARADNENLRKTLLTAYWTIGDTLGLPLPETPTSEEVPT